jgi:hypothetical protein
MIVLKKPQKPIGTRPRIAMFMQPMGLFNMHPRGARLFPFERAEGRGEEGILLNFGVPSKFPHALNNSQ